MRWIMHADDFGETEEITRGIVEAMRAGAVTSTSIMANMPGTEFALKIASKWPGNQSFGVHINLCEGRPLSDGQCFRSASGEFLGKREIFIRSVTGRLDRDELEIEIEQQVRRIVDGDVNVSHLDGHKHLHQLPIVREAVSAVAARFDIQRVRVTRDRREWRSAHGVTNALSAMIRNRVGHAAARRFSQGGLKSPAYVIDISALMQQGDTVARMIPDDVVEVFCHPGTREADMEKPGSCDRSAELEFLTSPAFKEICSRHKVQLMSYWEL